MVIFVVCSKRRGRRGGIQQGQIYLEIKVAKIGLGLGYLSSLLFKGSSQTPGGCWMPECVTLMLEPSCDHTFKFQSENASRVRKWSHCLDVVDVIDGILIHGISFPTCSGAGIISLVLSMAMISSFQNQIKLYSGNDAVQVNYFNCGGVAISICIWHAVADASTLATFVNCWAAISRDPNNVIDEVVFDCTTLFPPQDLSSFSLHSFVKEDVSSEIVMKRFLFDGSKLASLRDEVGNGPYLDRPSRFIAVSTLILTAMMTVTRENEAMQINAATIAVDLRRRLKPPSAKTINWKHLPSDNSKMARE
ncbi:hypothetical protein D5086_011908 [Populus alba]|uniref:Uncharacterized protein n=1 Tax=Populus alba TaxID=43335 RepID=A0ACC4C1B6_POPAL